MRVKINYAKPDICPACGRPYEPYTSKKKGKIRSEHHVLPRRFFKEDNNKTVHLCRLCHSELERDIPQWKRQTPEHYLKILNLFLRKRALQTNNMFQAYAIYSQNAENYIIFLFDIDIEQKQISNEMLAYMQAF